MSMFDEQIAPEHEYRHTPDDDPDYNESSYYNFACPTSGVVGWMRVAMQANRPSSQASILLFLPGGETLFDHTRTSAVSPDQLTAGGIRFEILEPHVRQRISFAGDLAQFADPRALNDPSNAFRDAPRRPATVDLEVTGHGQSFGTNGDTAANVLEETLAIGHYEQFITVDGEVRIGDERLHVRGGGLRDHSWGPRDWTGPLSYRWITSAFDDGSFLMALQVLRRDGTVTRRVATARGGTATAGDLEDLRMRWTEDGFCRQVEVAVVDEGRPVTVTATAREPERYVPLRHRRTAEDGTELLTRIGYSAYGFTTSDGRTGTGIVEVLDQLDDGLPIGMRADLAAGAERTT